MTIWHYLGIGLTFIVAWVLVELWLERRRPHSRKNFIRIRNLEAMEDAHAEQAEVERRHMHRRRDDPQFPIGQ